MKIYHKLKLPKDNAWERKTWRSYVHWKIKYFIDGIHNIIRWMPTLYHDHDWDENFILRMLQKKIEYQRAHLVENNRHTRIDEDNFWMTVTLNLIERELQEYYNLEHYDYIDIDIKFVPYLDHKDRYEIKSTTLSSNLEEYFGKYKAAVQRVLRANNNVEFSDSEKLAFYVSRYNQERNRKLLFTILEKYSNRWWD